MINPICIPTNTPAFRELYDSLNIDENSLRTEIYNYVNSHNGEWPTKQQLMEIFKPSDYIDASDVQVELRDSLYGTEKILNTKEELDSYLSELNKYFPKEAISYYTNKDGKYAVNVANLENQKEIKEILDKAPRNSDGKLLAPNGKVSHLTERQYAQVRTKAFLKWFGDWINDPENASKVVDENGEPLVVIHNTTEPNITTFKVSSLGAIYFANKKGQDYVNGFLRGENNYEMFANIRNPVENTMEAAYMNDENDGFFIRYTAKQLKDMVENGEYTKEELLEEFPDLYELSDDTLVFAGGVKTSNQVKSATSNKGTFSLEEDNMYKYMFRNEEDYKSFLKEMFLFREPVESFMYNFIKNILKVNPKNKKIEYGNYDAVLATNNNTTLFLNSESFHKLLKSIFSYDVYLNANSKEEALEAVKKELDTWEDSLKNKIHGEDRITSLRKEAESIKSEIQKLKRLLRGNFKGIESLSKELQDEYNNYLNRAEKVRGKKKVVTFNQYIGSKLHKLNTDLNLKNEQINNRKLALGSEIIAAKNRLTALYTINNIKDLILKRIEAEIDSYKMPEEEYAKAESVRDLYEAVKNADSYKSDSVKGLQSDTVKGISLDKLIEEVTKQFPEYADFLQTVKRINPRLNIQIGHTYSEGVEGTQDGGYTPRSNSLEISKDANINTIIHELAHSITFFGNEISEGGNKEKAFHKSIDTFMDYVRDYIDSKNLDTSALRPFTFMGKTMEGVPTGVYGFTNANEFIAEVYGNPRFRELLRLIPPMESKKFNSLFDQIIDVINNFIKSIFGKKYETALDQALTLGEASMKIQEAFKDYTNEVWNEYENQNKNRNTEIELKSIIKTEESLSHKLSETQSVKNIGNKTALYGVRIDRNLKNNYGDFQKENPNGIVAYRVNYNIYNTAEEANAGRIGNPFSEGIGGVNKGEDTVQKFYDWLVTGNNFGEDKATEEYRQAIINKILSTPKGTPILYYDELNRVSHATVLGYLINNKYLLNSKKVTLSTTGYKKGDPQRNPNTAYVFTENAEAYAYSNGIDLNPMGVKFPNTEAPKINVSDVRGTNQAGIRTDVQGNISPNAFGIIVKKFQQDSNGRFVAKEGQFQDTKEDFKLFTSLNEDMFKRLHQSSNKEIIFPTQMGLGKAALPLKFAEWLQNELENRFSIISEIEENKNGNYNGYGLSIKQINSQNATSTQKDFQRAEEVKKELDKTLGTSEEVKSEIKDTIKLAQEGVTYQQYIDSIEPFFTKEELTQIFSAVPQAHANFKDRKTGDWAYKGQLQVTSVSRNTDPVFFSKEIVNFLKENSKKSLNDPTRTNVIEIWSKHDGEPIQDILEACKKYRVAPIVSFSITSMGDTALEKGVMKYQDMLDRVKQLIENGTLNAKTTTVRLDPILIGETNMDKVLDVAEQCSNMGIKKFVVSLVQSYGYMDGTARDRHVTSGINEALAKEGRTYDWDKYYGRDRLGKINFKPKREYIDEIGNILKDFLSKHKDIKLETCAFSIPGMKASACLDPLIMERLVGKDVTRKDGTYDRDTSRPDCMCYGAHSDMFRINEKKCFSSCAYCYAGRSGDNPLNYYNEDGSLKDNPFTRVRQSDKTPSRYEGWTQEELMKEKQERQQNEESSEAVKKNPIREIENQKFMEEQSKLNTQFDNLLNSDALSASDIADIAEQAVFSISDLLTEIQESQDANKTIEDMFGIKLDKIDANDATRMEIANAIGIKNLLEYAKNVFYENAQNADNWDVIDKADLIVDNWDAILLKANSVFSQIENFGLTTDKGLTIDESTQKLLDDFNNTEDPDALQEILGSLQEHWQVESRTQDVIDSMSEVIKKELFNLYLKDENGNIITSEFGIKRRVKARDAVNSILRWVQGARNLEEMIELIEGKSKDNTWVTPLLTKLKDTSGTYTTLQSQFYRTMYKPFQLYDVIIKEDGKWASKTVNKDPAMNLAIKSIKALASIGKHPLMTNNGINKEAFKNLNTALQTMQKIVKEGIKAENTELFARAANYVSNTLGYSMDVNTMIQFVNNANAEAMTNALSGIMNVLAKNIDEVGYNPFDYEGGITGFMKNFMAPIMDKMEDVAISSFYDSGKMYQSYVTPSFLTMMFDKFHLQDNAKFNEFIQNEFGKYSWFKRQDAKGNTGWRVEWVRELVTDAKAREVFAHKVNLSFDKLNYMRGLNSMQYTLSVANEYFSESTNSKETRVPAWFRVPMMSNKPSSEFIRFYSERGSNYKDVIANKLKKVFDQELSRIQDVRTSNYSKKDQAFIKNFDTNGRKFQFLKWMNDYLEGGKKADKQLGKLIEKKLSGEKLSTEEEANLNTWATQAIKSGLEEHFQQVLSEYEKKGILKEAEKIANINKHFNNTRDAIENFLWNDFFASTQILEMTITDIAYYEDTVDLQKRLAQLHAPGIRGNKFATDFGGDRVSDGTERSIVLTDFDRFKSNIIENIGIVFDKKIAEAPPHLKAAYKAMKESIIEQFKRINVADAQAYNSPTSYRKKAFIFGTWNKKAEEVYQRLMSGNYTFGDLEVAFQPLKPFVYGHAEKDRGGLMGRQRVPIQNKNSEYLLIMADAILQGEKTGRPNLLRALYTVMEESAKRNPTKGIDTIQFESAVKSGLQGKIDLTPFAEDLENGETNAIAAINASIYNEDGSYNTNSVHELDFDYYAIQQEVPAHFLNHEQAHGSQERYIIPSDLASLDANGNAVLYNVEGRQLTAQEFKAEYEQTISDNIEESIENLKDELQLSGTRKEKNIALARILQKEVNSSPRYGAELSQALLLDENGEFRIPKGDPIQAKRIEQLLNSIVKNRVNKQEIAGGPVVQASNFGTSKELSIRFKDKNGGLLKTRKEFEGSDAEFKAYIRENQGGIAYMECFAPIYMAELFKKFANPDGTIDIEAIEATNPDLLKLIGYRIPTEAKYSISPLKIVGFLPREAGDAVMLPNDITLLNGSDFDIDKLYLQRLELTITTKKRSDIAKELYDRATSKMSNLKYSDKAKISEQIEMFLDNPEVMRTADEFMNSLWYDYKRIAYKVEAPTEGRTYRNNKIVNMTYEVLTHETSAEQMLNPGGFEEQKNVGYMVEAYKTTDKSWSELEGMSTSELKDLISSDENLGFFDVHTRFYKQNSVAGAILGMFAVQRIAHATLEGNGFKVVTSSPMTICGMKFEGSMEFDMQYSKDGQLIGKVLGSLVASAADAVKGPVLNLMNINNDTANLLTGLIRLGMPFRDVALLLSQKAVTDTMEELEASSFSGQSTNLFELIDSKLKKLEKKYGIKEGSTLYKEELTRDELIIGLKADDSKIQLKTLNAIKNLSRITNSLKGPSYCTRFNSISNAVGPLAIDNIMMEYKLKDFSENIIRPEGGSATARDVFAKHPILNSFAKSLNIANSLLEGMPGTSSDFRRIVSSFESNNISITKNRQLLSKLSDFYQTYLLYQSEILRSEDAEYFINNFANDFIEMGYKNLDGYKDNPIIQAIKVSVDKNHENKPVLNIDITGMENADKEHISSGWTDLFKKNRELAESLIWYNIYRRGVGFSPETFISLLPNYIKERLDGYRETFTTFPTVAPELVMDQFVRNYASKYPSLAPTKDTKILTANGDGTVTSREENAPSYIKIKEGKNEFRLYRLKESYAKDAHIYEEISTLGNNGEFLEMSTDNIDKPITANKTLEEAESAESIAPKSTEVQDSPDATTPSKQEVENAENESLYELMAELGGKPKEEVKTNFLRDKAEGKTKSKLYQMKLKNHFKEKLIEKGMADKVSEIDEYLKKLC